jgi:hypothetical protein
MAAHRKYPWEQWFGRPSTVLVRGIDYQCSQSTMVQTIRNNASARGLRVQPTDKGTEILIEVRGAVGGGTKYPWAEWFNGTLRLIEKGTDYTVETDKIPGKVKNAARRLYKIVQISRRDADDNKLADSLIIRARDMTAAERVAEDLRRAEQTKGKASGVDFR